MPEVKFDKLPREVKNEIWKWAREPRLVDVQIIKGELWSFTKPEDSVSEVVKAIDVDEGSLGAAFQALANSEGGLKFVRVDPAVDVVDIVTTDPALFEPVAKEIQRLKLWRRMTINRELRSFDDLKHFVNLKEIYFVPRDHHGLEACYGAIELDGCPCDKESCFYVDPIEGTVHNAVDWEKEEKERRGKDGMQRMLQTVPSGNYAFN